MQAGASADGSACKTLSRAAPRRARADSWTLAASRNSFARRSRTCWPGLWPCSSSPQATDSTNSTRARARSHSSLAWIKDNWWLCASARASAGSCGLLIRSPRPKLRPTPNRLNLSVALNSMLPGASQGPHEASDASPFPPERSRPPSPSPPSAASNGIAAADRRAEIATLMNSPRGSRTGDGEGTREGTDWTGDEVSECIGKGDALLEEYAPLLRCSCSTQARVARKFLSICSNSP
mmetsp:Transcript_125986/g.403363  ORF Transcript_125986/g.403363 Transcript_125986/m.403363 type:complete len:237 (-) Transcript_125986:514-1224(-)